VALPLKTEMEVLAQEVLLQDVNNDRFPIQEEHQVVAEEDPLLIELEDLLQEDNQDQNELGLLP